MFELIKTSTKTKARLGRIHTAHGTIETPVFMPVGTQGTVKSLTPQILETLGLQIILANTYHLYLRPGTELLAKVGGLHKFMNWSRPILTDSGGFQVFSLSKLRKLTDDGVLFQSHLDGSEHLFTPKKVIDIQKIIGSDIMMVLDECVEAEATKNYVEKSVALTTSWAKRSYTHWQKDPRNKLFGIVQGGMHKDLRKRSSEEICGLDFPGYAIGGLSVGEEKELMYEIADFTADLLPQHKPRYLMGVGMPEDIIQGIHSGIDMFDCVLPTRLARHGSAFSPEGLLNLNNAQYKDDLSPLVNGCNCYCCQNFSRAYLRHLVNAKEILAIVLLTIHNIHYLKELVEKEKQKILAE